MGGSQVHTWSCVPVWMLAPETYWPGVAGHQEEAASIGGACRVGIQEWFSW